jgi:hypothetical protein
VRHEFGALLGVHLKVLYGNCGKNAAGEDLHPRPLSSA